MASDDTRETLAVFDDIHFLSHTEGIYEKARVILKHREDAGEKVGGHDVMKLVYQLQTEAGIIDRACS